MVTNKATIAERKKKTVKESARYEHKEDSFEISSLVSADKILGFLKGKAIGLAEMAGGKITGWVAGQVLELIGFQEKQGPSQLDEIEKTLKAIEKAVIFRAMWRASFIAN